MDLDVMIVSHPDGNVEVITPGSLPAGGFSTNSRFVTISGSGIPTAPKGRMSQQQYQDWLAKLQSQGFQVTDK